MGGKSNEEVSPTIIKKKKKEVPGYMRETVTKEAKVKAKPRESLYVRPALQKIISSDEGTSQKVIPIP